MNNTTKLILKILFAILIGGIIGRILILNSTGVFILRGFVTFSDVVSQFLSFFVPIAVLTLVMPGIIELGQKATKMLIAGIAISFISFIVIGLVCVFFGYFLIPSMLSTSVINHEIQTVIDISGFLPVIISPFFDIITAMIIAFSFGIAATKVESANLVKVVKEVEACSYKILNSFLIPILPLYIFCILAKLSASGELFANLNNFVMVLFLVFVVSNGYTVLMMFVLSKLTGRSFASVLKAYLPAYLVAFGTRSSKATIPVSLASAEKIGVSKEVREFAVPLFATTHMLGDMAMQIFGAMALFYIFTGEMISLSLMLSYVLLLSTILIAAPGTPGGVVVTTKPFLTSFLGFPPAVSETFFAIGITNDSFATGTNVLGDGILVMILEKINKKLSKEKNI
jgi:Na+/H+-dicarboxylate symporter